jgi:hypothetical protein
MKPRRCPSTFWKATFITTKRFQLTTSRDLGLEGVRSPINMKFSGFLASLLVLFALVQCSLQQCYNMDGSIAAHHIACTEFASASDALVPCCEPGRTCLPNGMCSSSASDPNLERESCTDQTWKSDNCPKFCGQGKLVFFCKLLCVDGN